MPNATPTFFFHSHDFIFRNPEDKIVSFSVGEGDTEVAIHFTEKNNALISLERSPFGGFVFQSALQKNVMLNLLENVNQYAVKNNIQSIEVRCAPEIYLGADSRIVNDVFREKNFTVMYKDIAQALKMNEPLLLNRNRRRLLTKGREKKFDFRMLTIDFLEEAYALIVQSRDNKSYPVTMQLADLRRTFDAFPENYLLFGVFDEQKMVACSVSIVVNAQILYCFYLGDALSHRKYSPVTLIVNEMYNYAVEKKFAMIDLGISTDRGMLNPGLYRFKKSLGCVDVFKLTYAKHLE